MTKYYKYPHTPYLSFSPTIESIDETDKSIKLIFDNNELYNKEWDFTLKMDGENATLYRDHIHARSLDSRHHESRSYVKGLHSEIKHRIPEGWRICGENLYAVHSIKYDDLWDYFLVFSVWDENNMCLSVLDTLEFLEPLGLRMCPSMKFGISTLEKNGKFGLVNHRGPFYKILDVNLIQVNFLEEYPNEEGFVIRNANSFHFDDFHKNVAKWVRPNHVQTDQHWMHKKIEKNGLTKVRNFGFFEQYVDFLEKGE